MGAFGKIRHTTIKGEKGTTWYVELWKEGHTDASIDMTLAGEGFTITWNGEGSTRNRNFLGSECVLNLYVQNDADEILLYNILSSGFRKYFIRIYKNSTAATDIWWYGWIAPAFDSIENAPYPYQSSITATDSYGYYSQRPIDTFQMDGSDGYQDVMDRNRSVADICTDFIKNMDLYTDASGDGNPIPDGIDFMSISMLWTIASQASQVTPPPSERYYISKAPFVISKDFPREYKESDVFRDVLKVFNLTGMLAEGKYYFFQPNSYLDNSNSYLTFFNYDDLSYPANNDNWAGENHSLTITNRQYQTDNILLGGSSFTYEAPLKSVQVNYESVPSYFFIPPDFEVPYGTDFSGGRLRDSHYRMKFDLTHKFEVNLNNAIWATSAVPGSLYKTDYKSFSVGLRLTIKISDGTTTKWLAVQPSQKYQNFEWRTTYSTIVLNRGRYSGYQNLQNIMYDDTSYGGYERTWDIHSSIGDVESINNVDGPCFMGKDIVYSNETPGYVEYTANFVFDESVPRPGFEGELEITMDGGRVGGSPPSGTALDDPYVVVYQYALDEKYSGSSATHTVTKPLITYGPVQNVKGVINEFTFTKEVESSVEVLKDIYTSTQSVNTAVEQLDLGNVTIGQSQDPKSSIRDANKDPIQDDFQVGTNTSTSAESISQLLTDQFLEMQVSPLQILQGSIQSADISPLKIIKYKLNSLDADYGYYMFQGGTFKANSEIMDGEWFKLKKD